MLKDAVVVGPVLVAGGFALGGLSEAGYRPNVPTTEYLTFLAFLAAVLMIWYRWKLGAAERLRALELGHDRPAPAPAAVAGNPLASATGLLLGAPVGVAAMAWLTCLTTRCEPNFVWSMVALMGVTSIACGTFLAARQPVASRAGHAHAAATRPADGLKTFAHDPDTFDVVGRRG